MTAGIWSAEETERVREGYREAGRLVRHRAKNFYFAFLGQPAPARRALHAIYAFCREADDATDDGADPTRATEALDALRTRLAAIYEGEPTRARDWALKDAARTYPIARHDFARLLDGVARDLEQRRYATFDDLYRYCFGVASSVGLLCLPVFGRRDALARRHAVDLGVGMQLTNILRDLAEDAARGRVYVPQEDLRRFGLEERALLELGALEPGERASGKLPPALGQLIRFEAVRARRYLESGRRLLPLLERRSRFCPGVLAGLYGQLLKRIEVLGERVLQQRVTLPGVRKAALAMRTFATTRWGSSTGGAS